MHVSYGLHNLIIFFFPFELVHLKVDISLSIDIFFCVCKAKIYTVLHSETETAESAPCLLSLILQKRNVLLLL